MYILFELFIVFFKIGLVSFGGGYAMVSIIQKEVEVYQWLTAAEYAKIVTISQMTPGPIAVNVATYVGATVCGDSTWFAILGAFFATLGVAMPSFIIMLLLAGSLAKFSKSKQLKWLMGGVRPAIIGVMLAAVIFFGKLAFLKEKLTGLSMYDFSSLFNALNPIGILIGVIAFVLHYRFSVGPIKIIVLTGLAGFLFI